MLRKRNNALRGAQKTVVRIEGFGCHDEGTWIVPDEKARPRTPGTIAGIAGRKGFMALTVSKFAMNELSGFLRDACDVFLEYGVNLEHIPTSIDDASFVVSSESLNGKLEVVLSGLKNKLNPDTIKVEPPLSLICVVGNTMSHTPGVAGKVFKDALAARGINVRLIIQGGSERNITIGVDEDDLEEAIRAIYEVFA
ncbi:MAG: ACT domain-containing protein [Minisyncoccia bacterium]